MFTTVVDVAKEYPQFFWRYTAQEFLKTVILPKFENNTSPITIKLGNGYGWSSGWLQEVFGGLVTSKNWKTPSEVKANLIVETTSASIWLEIKEYIDNALRERFLFRDCPNNESPEVTNFSASVSLDYNPEYPTKMVSIQVGLPED